MKRVDVGLARERQGAKTQTEPKERQREPKTRKEGDEELQEETSRERDG